MRAYLANQAIGGALDGTYHFGAFEVVPHPDGGFIPGCVALKSVATGKYRNVDPGNGKATDDREHPGADERFLPGAGAAYVAIPGTMYVAGTGWVFPGA